MCVCAQPCRLFVTSWTAACQVALSLAFPRQNTGVSGHSLLRGIFLTQGLKLHLLCLQRWRVDSLPLVQTLYKKAKIWMKETKNRSQEIPWQASG